MSRHLMAKMASGRRKTAGWADWKQIPEHELGWSNAKDQWKASLENGHELWVYGHNDQPRHSGGGGYIAALDNLPYDPEDPSDKAEDGAVWLHHVRGDDFKLKQFPTREHAMQAAEAEYEKHFPIGTDTGGHDSGVDYDDIFRNLGDHL